MNCVAENRENSIKKVGCVLILYVILDRILITHVSNFILCLEMWEVYF